MREFKDLKGIDLKLKLLNGASIKVDSLDIAPYTLGEISKYGYSNYMEDLQWLSATIDDFIDSVLDLEKKVYLLGQRSKLKEFDFYVKLGGVEFQTQLLHSLAMIFKTTDIRILEDNVVGIDFVKDGILTIEHGEIIANKERLDSIKEDEIKLVHRDNFNDIVKVIKLQNYLTKPEVKNELDENPVDEETRALMEQMKKNNEKVKAIKKNQNADNGVDDDIDLVDIISAVSSKSHSLNKLNIWDLTLYQLYDEYSRLELIDSYDFSIRAMMAGAKKVDLRHWSSKI